jgi:8-oxo-dGTP diphosphatase
VAASFTIGAFAIVFDDEDRVLLCHRRDIDLWNLPGGGVETGETPWDAAVREVREETGFEVMVQRLQGVYVKPETDDVVFSFICVIRGGIATLNDEADRIDWFGKGELPPNTSLKQRERILDALTRVNDMVLHAQFGPSSAERLGHHRRGAPAEDSND